MTRIRVLTVAALLFLPFAFLFGTGVYHLFMSGWIFYAWWPLAGCLAAAYILAWRWQKEHHRNSLSADVPIHSTDRDKVAWKTVEKYAALMPTKAELDDSEYYFRQARKLSEEIAQLYYPDSRKPIGCVTLPELLTAIELAMAEVREKLEAYMPGSHLLSINNFQHAGDARAWIPRVQNAMWVGSAIMDPVRTGMRYFANRYGVITPLDRFQENLIAWFYATFVQRVGYYLIELYSGRLKVGTEQYRKVMKGPAAEGATVVPDPTLPPMQIAVVGSTASHKTDLVRALLGNVELVPPGKESIFHRLELRDVPEEIRLVDTPAYGDWTPKGLRAFEPIIESADLLLWVVNAGDLAPADKALHAHFREYYAKNPNRKSPPVLCAVTGVETLEPADEWQPPYEWQEPQGIKERSINETIGKLQAAIADPFISLVPVCVSAGKVWGIDEYLDPLIHLGLNDARAVARLRQLEAKGRSGRYGKVVDQVFSGGRQVLGGLLGRLHGEGKRG